METIDWMESGECADHPASTFFPSDGVGVDIAKRICGECAMKDTCLEFALRNRIEHGVWGGASERQRRRLLKQRSVKLAIAN